MREERQHVCMCVCICICMQSLGKEAQKGRRREGEIAIKIVQKDTFLCNSFDCAQQERESVKTGKEERGERIPVRYSTFTRQQARWTKKTRESI